MDVDALTLEYLAKSYRREKPTEVEDLVIVPLDDIKFYRKRINNLFKARVVDILNKQQNESTCDYLIMRICREMIDIFQRDDMCELINNECLEQALIAEAPTAKAPTAEALTAEAPLAEALIAEALIGQSVMLPDSTVKTPTLDDFVIKKSIKFVHTPTYPKQNAYNLADKAFKYKGITKKSE